MTKDGVADKQELASKALHHIYDRVLQERIPDDLRALVERLK